MTSLGYSPVPGDNSNQVLQPTGLANPSNSHFTDPIPQYSSIVGAVAGCGGAGGSAAALAGNGNPGYNVVKQTGGRSHRRGGSKKRHAHKSHKKGKKTHKRSRCRRCCKRGKRSMRGGLLSLSPAPFSGAANLPYNQFMGNQAVSYNYGIGSETPLPLDLVGTATPGPMMDIHNNCGSNLGMVSKGLIL